MQDNWKIDYQASSGWTVYEYITLGAESKKPGESYWLARTFHATPEQACMSLYNRLLALELQGRGTDLTDHLTKVIEAIAAAQERVEAVAGNIKAGAL